MVELRKSRKFRNISSQSVVRLCKYVLQQLGLDKCSLSVSLVDDNEMTKLNRKYFKKNRTTDVISFPMEKDIINGILLGDVVVSVPQAERGAAENNLSVSEELSLYLIHGILHLAGERDGKPGEYRKMEKKQMQILKSARQEGLLAKARDFA